MLGKIHKLFDTNDREVKKLLPVVEQINALEKETQKLKDSDFPKRTQQLRDRVQKGESIYLVLPEAFALAREAARRTIGQRHYDVQMMAGIVLAQGKVAEQKTGEGKTLSAVPALFLHSLTGKSVHLVTVNDYLARRDAGWMGSIFNFLGVSVAAIISDQSFEYDTTYVNGDAKDARLRHLKNITRKEAYEKDVVYGINSEFGFDYLRDNMAQRKEDLVQKDYYFAAVDEVDSVLVDEARTPHIISAPDATPSQKYYEYAQIISKLSASDYKIDEKMRTAHLTENGIIKIEKMFGVQDIYEKDFDTVYHIEAALKAQTLYHKDKEYIVRDGQVILIDEFTGRLLEGRRLSEGLHQALEAKEGVAVQHESKTLATISLQNYFRMYEKLAGMTGTAVTEAEEFQKIYKLDVVSIPTHQAMKRKDEADVIYKTTRAKVAAIVREIEEAYKKGQPVLVGTTSIEKNEVISEYLKHKKIPHEVLNAKNHMREALIIKDAGRKGAVTVATNMAGRGVDIILGGQPPSNFDFDLTNASEKKQYEKEVAQWEKEHEEVLKLGGLFVIGTEKHESRRIDNQLRGRSGRQGDPGRSVFIISLEDELMRVFGGEQIANLMTKFNFPEDTPLTHALVTRVITQAQVKVEGFYFENRKRTVEYDDVLNKQREIVYKLRRNLLLDEQDMTVFVMDKIRAEINRIVVMNLNPEVEGGGYKEILNEFVNIVPFDEKSQEHLLKHLSEKQNPEEATNYLVDVVEKIEKKREEDFGTNILDQVAKSVSLTTIDNLWMSHLTAIEDLRTGIGLRGYGQRDPLVEYKNEAFGMFERLMGSIDDGIISRFFRIVIQAEKKPEVALEKPKRVMLNQPASEIGDKAEEKQKPSAKNNLNVNEQKPSKEVIKEDKTVKLGRNDPCWCGSGKKWKKCHYPEVAS